MSFWRAERQIRPPGRQPNNPLDVPHLSEFSAGPENSHGASDVHGPSPHGSQPTATDARNVADPRRCERHQRNTQRKGGREPEPLVAASSGNLRLDPAACAVRLVGRGTIALILTCVYPARRELRRRISGWGSGLCPAPVSAFPGAGQRPEPQPSIVVVLNTLRRANTLSTGNRGEKRRTEARRHSRIRRRAPP